MTEDFRLRPYQVDALNTVDKDLQEEQFVLLQAIMGAGKTVMISRLINRYWFETERKFLILAHKGLLVEQFMKAFKDMTNVPLTEIGICSAGLKQRELGKRLTIATVQTFINVVGDYPGAELTVIDECHRITVGTDSQYDKVIDSLTDKVPNMRLIGLTATPARLDHGYIYGDRCREGNINLFKKVNYQVKYSELLAQGYLCKLQGKIAHSDTLVDDLESVAVHGDYVLNQLGEVMTKEIHLRTAVEAIHAHCGGYNMICVFCTTIAHAEQLTEMLGPEICTTIHSDLSPIQRQINMESWLSGKTTICTSINILAEGFDFPALDCLVFARPTLSSTLFLQAVGRALRISPGKDHGFLLDLTDNTTRFGTDLDNVRITIPKAVKKDILEDPLIKLCPNCEREVFVSLKVCPHCDYEWPVAEIIEANHVPNLKEVTFEVTKKEPPEWVNVHGMEIVAHEARKSGKMLGRIEFCYGYVDFPAFVSLWLCLPDFYEGYAVQMAAKKWDQLTDGALPFPDSVEDLIDVRDQLVAPSKILLEQDGKYPNIIDMEWEHGMSPSDHYDHKEEEEEYAESYTDKMYDDDIPF